MQSQDFCYWLKGFIELTDGQSRPSELQWECIKRHLDLVFVKQTSTFDELSKPKEALSKFEDPKTPIFIC